MELYRGTFNSILYSPYPRLVLYFNNEGFYTVLFVVSHLGATLWMMKEIDYVNKSHPNLYTSIMSPIYLLF